MEKFGVYLFPSRECRIYGLAAFLLTAVIWLVFKYCYPTPNLVFDSYQYIRAADLRLGVNAWPIGYSIFIRAFTFFSHSANLLVACQYFLLNFSLLLFFFTWLWLFQPGRLAATLFFVLLFVNPLVLYLANYILADPLFISLSILWLVQLIWLVVRQKPIYILTQALLLTAAFTVRYNAIYYPVIAVFAILLTQQRRLLKMAGIAFTLLLPALFVVYTSQQSKKISGVSQFSAFGGWKLANDALYVYGSVEHEPSATVPTVYAPLDSLVRTFFAQHPDWQREEQGDPSSGSYFMFEPASPLIQYMEQRYGGGWPYFGTVKWFSVASLYQDYGLYILRRYPGVFLRRFVWPNCGNYLAPPREVLGSPVPFVLHESFGAEYVRSVFGLRTLDTPERFIKLSGSILYFYPAVFAMLHCFFLSGMLFFFLTGGLRTVGRPIAHCMLLIALLWGIDLGFSLLSAAVVLRYQIFMSIIELAWGIYCFGFVYRRLALVEAVP